MTHSPPTGRATDNPFDSIDWPEPRHADLTWEWDDVHMPRALDRIGQAYVRTLAGGMAARAIASGLPIVNLGIAVHGYAYFSLWIDAPESDHDALRAASAAWNRTRVDGAEVRWRDEQRPEAEAIYEEMDRLPLADADGDGLARAWERAWAMADRIWDIHFDVIVGPYQALEDLADLVTGRFPDIPDGDVLALAGGSVEDLALVDAGLDSLVDRINAEPGLLDHLRATPPPTLDELRRGPAGHAAFTAAVDAFLAVHGHLGHMTEDLREASWSEEPERLLADLVARVGRAAAGLDSRQAHRADAAEALEARIRSDLADEPELLGRFEQALAAARAIGWLTEGHNYWLDRKCGDSLRRFTRRIGARLVAAGAIDDAEDIRHFDRDEVGPLLRNPTDQRPLVAERKAELAARAAIVPPRTIGRPPDPAAAANADRFDGRRIVSDDERVLRGSGASAGVVRATARVVNGPDDFERVRPGDIVVARASNPGWVPLFGIAAGFVTDTGGVLCHAAVVAREFGVPAVVGTGDATARIRDGQIVEIDGSAGTVRLG